MTYYVKLTDGRLIYAPKKLIVDGATVYNPTAAMLTAQGWKPLRVEDAPAVEDGYHLEPVYSETETEVVQGWSVVEDGPVEPSIEERLQMQEDALVELAELISEVMA